MRRREGIFAAFGALTFVGARVALAQQAERSKEPALSGRSFAPLPEFDRTTLSRIYPYVVPRSWVDYTTREALVWSKCTEDVYVVLVIDGNGTVRNVRPEDLRRIGVSEDEAYDLAARNLAEAWKAEKFSFGMATLRDETKIGTSTGNWMAPAGALAIGSFHAGLRERFGRDEFVAVAVNQQMLFAFPNDAKTLGSKSLRLAIDDEFRTSSKPISRSWMLLDGGWPREYPGQQLF